MPLACETCSSATRASFSKFVRLIGSTFFSDPSSDAIDVAISAAISQGSFDCPELNMPDKLKKGFSSSGGKFGLTRAW